MLKHIKTYYFNTSNKHTNINHLILSNYYPINIIIYVLNSVGYNKFSIDNIGLNGMIRITLE